MKKIILPTVCLLLAVMLIGILPTEADCAIYEDTVRLHILAKSDSREDQELKLYLRDKILAEYSGMLGSSSSSAEAAQSIRDHLEEIENRCNEWLSERDTDSHATVTLTEEWYGTREYSDFSLPSGNYLSLKIVIDEGDGQNWWCVMYPPLCLDVATETNSSYSEEENRLITGSGYAIKFKLLEITSSFFKR